MVSPSLRSGDAENQSAKRQSNELSDTNTSSEAESGSESEYNGGRSIVRRLRRKTAASSIAAKVVQRRRAAGRSKVIAPQGRVSWHKAVTPPRTATSPEESEGSEGEDGGDGYEDQDSAGSSPARVLKWKDIPYPGFPVRGSSQSISASLHGSENTLMLTSFRSNQVTRSPTRPDRSASSKFQLLRRSLWLLTGIRLKTMLLMSFTP